MTALANTNHFCHPGALAAGQPIHLGLGHHYRLDRPMAQSSCGAVWHATWLETSAPVVIKTLAGGAESAQQRSAWRQALQREGEQLRRLRHRHIIRLQHVGTHAGKPLLVLEPMHESMAQHLARLKGAPAGAAGSASRLPPGLALRWAHQIAQGLRVLHRTGLRHLDLKPANLLLTAPGPLGQRLKMADFGACLAATTPTHHLLATPGWAAPEQLRPVGCDAQGQPLFQTDARADFFALGQLLFRWLTGQRTHYGSSVWAAYRRGGAADVFAVMANGSLRGGLTAEDWQRLGAVLGGMPDPMPGHGETAAEANAETNEEADQATWIATGQPAGFQPAAATPTASPAAASEQGHDAGHAATTACRRLLGALCQPTPEARPGDAALVCDMLTDALAEFSLVHTDKSQT